MACHTQDDFGPEPARGDFSVEYERAGSTRAAGEQVFQEICGADDTRALSPAFDLAGLSDRS